MYTPAIAALALPIALLLIAGNAAAESATDCLGDPCEGNYNLNISEDDTDGWEQPRLVIVRPKWTRPAEPATAPEQATAPPTEPVPDTPPAVVEPPAS
jgi:hypothetical protein